MMNFWKAEEETGFITTTSSTPDFLTRSRGIHPDRGGFYPAIFRVRLRSIALEIPCIPRLHRNGFLSDRCQIYGWPPRDLRYRFHTRVGGVV
ncbi:hypothetical protein GDO81_023325 [Engystomops pustulosus]|uniref:Uncharacterized protein n=1 Tax=Engystomops pustulosus TaxID=76066 RepID=A0AAV6YL11_ENGPU|nr:hypothetical protein GDO81_023325 [Engystomops pustulosus]